FTSLCRRAGLSGELYVRWIKEKKVPDEWRPYLFAEDSPADGFVVDRGLQRLRYEMSPSSILRAAGMGANSKETLRQWERDPTIHQALEWVIAWAKTGGNPDRNPTWPESAQVLHGKVKQHLLAYARKATLSSCLERAGLTQEQYASRLKKAQKCGVRETLEQFLQAIHPFERVFGSAGSGRKGSQFGLVARNFFIPSPKMLSFRDEALKERQE